MELKGNLKQQKGLLKKEVAKLTGDDRMHEEGQKDVILGKLQVKLGKTKEELHSIFRSL